jgi:hypothetical protein
MFTVIFTIVLSTCDTLTTQDACVENCWCKWRTESKQVYYNTTNDNWVTVYPEACIEKRDDCHYRSGCECYWNTSTMCSVYSTVFSAVFVSFCIVMMFLSGLFILAILSLLIMFAFFIVKSLTPIALFIQNYIVEKWWWIKYIVFIIVVALISCFVYAIIGMLVMLKQSMI